MDQTTKHTCAQCQGKYTYKNKATHYKTKKHLRSLGKPLVPVQQKVQLRPAWYITILTSQRANDIGRFKIDEHYMDKECLVSLREEQKNTCYYCHIAMIASDDGVFKAYTRDRLTAERKDNTLPHTKQNIVLACLHCNNQRNSKYSFDQFYKMKENERTLNAPQDEEKALDVVPTEDEDLSEDEEEYAQYLLIREQDVLTPEEFEIYLKHHTRDGMPLSDDDKLFLRDMRGYA
jgi:hypothetical protein